MTRRSGFTLIELLLVIMIIGTLAAIVGASFSGSGQRARLDASARALVGLGRAARARASAEGRTYYLVVDPELHEARLARQRDPLARLEAEDEPELEISDEWMQKGAWSRAIPLEEGITVAQSIIAGVVTEGTATPENGIAPRVAFAPDGSAEEAAFDFEDGSGSRVRVVIEPSSARTRILTQDELDEAVAAGTALPPSSGASSQTVVDANDPAAARKASAATSAAQQASRGSAGSSSAGSSGGRSGSGATGGGP